MAELAAETGRGRGTSETGRSTGQALGGGEVVADVTGAAVGTSCETD